MQGCSARDFARQTSFLTAQPAALVCSLCQSAQPCGRMLPDMFHVATSGGTIALWACLAAMLSVAQGVDQYPMQKGEAT
ncbi:hypothetical protein BSN85_33080 [Bradyrhizobium brasilense]|nr:hypothetical protein BSN85_33080 [Bradyrhizobium brasilense]